MSRARSSGRKLPSEARLSRPASKELFKFEEIQSPPFSLEARVKTGQLLRLLQNGEKVEQPLWEPMTKSIGPGCGELRVRDAKVWWRIVCYVDAECVVVLDVFHKQTNETPDNVKTRCKKRLRDFLDARQG